MAQRVIAIAVHGGAWAIPDAEVQAHDEGVRAAAEAGYAVLKAGGSAIDAVEAAIRVLEDAPVFDAGTGSVLNAAGEVEMDALICDGASLRSGGVIGLDCVRHPISIARRVLEGTPHALLGGQGAKDFARAHAPPGDLCDPRELVTGAAREEWTRRKDYGDTVGACFDNKPPTPPSDKHAQQEQHDTVGCVALDGEGNIVAGTSTGGITMKMRGRVGDSPLVGCGAYADAALGGCSTTGHGESIMRVLLAHAAVANCRGSIPDCVPGQLEGRAPLPCSDTISGVLRGDDGCPKLPPLAPGGDAVQADVGAQSAANAAIAHMRERVDGYGGLVLISAAGGIGIAHSTKRMAYAARRGVVCGVLT